MSRSISSDKPFDLQDTSCCWIYNSNSASSWLLLTHVDLGTRSDTGFPNRSPVTTIPPIIRVPGNCPSAYTLMAHDLDGDRVRCRYGVASYSECYSCYRPPNFHLDESTCTLSFNGAGFGTTHVFELVLEDFSRQYITLRYGDGTTSTRIPFNFRKKRQSNFYTTSWWGTTTTTSGPSTTIPWSWRQRAPPTTSPPSAWWWGQPTSSRATTTTAPTTSPQQNAWWYNPSTTTTAPSTSTATPAQTTTTTAAPTTAAPTTTPFSTSSNYYDPLSKIPLQFIVQVDPAVPSCNFGEYRPQFLNPSPPHGIYVNASVGHEFQIPLRAAATRDRIYDIKISGPLNITKTLKNYNNSRGVIDVMITWTPTENDFGEHIPICFIAETASGYQSKMRCIIVVVVNENMFCPTIGEADIECTDTTMTLYISKSSVRGLHENHLRLNDPTCSVTSNGSHIIASVSLNSCGTKLEETEHDLIFRNEITSFENPHDIITRKHQIEIPFICKFPKKSRLSASFKAHKSAYLFTEAGFGSFTYLFEFYDSSAFSRMINPNSYPIEVQLQDMIYMDIQVQTSLSTTQLFVESCRATSNDNPSDPIYYDIISNGCIEDETTVVYLNNQTDFRFGLEAFNFIGNYEQVYISCTVILCVAGDPSNRCAQGCTNGTSIGHHHRKRSLASQSQRHFISQGPLRFARSSSGSPGNAGEEFVLL
ncbi:CUZD1 protein, partial [Polyodon spathula]|nr:CUZD1 protein [Polyodon spathula]